MHLRTLITKLTLRLAPCLIALCLSSRADAAPPTDANELESAIQAGIELRKGGNDDAALDLFLKLDHDNPGSVRLMLQVTAAAQAAGRWLVAFEYLRKAAVFKSDPYYQRNRAAIRSVEDAVGQHVGQFRAVGEPSGAEVRLSGKRLGTLPLAEPVAVELGSYVLEVSKPGYYSLRRDVTLAAGATLNQEVVELRPNAAASVPRVPLIQCWSQPSVSFSPMKIVCDVPSPTSSYRTRLLRKNTPLSFASIGFSASWCTPA